MIRMLALGCVLALTVGCATLFAPKSEKEGTEGVAETTSLVVRTEDAAKVQEFIDNLENARVKRAEALEQVQKSRDELLFWVTNTQVPEEERNTKVEEGRNRLIQEENRVRELNRALGLNPEEGLGTSPPPSSSTSD